MTFQDFKLLYPRSWGFPDGSAIKNLLAVQEAQAWFLGWEDPLEEGMATNSSIIAWIIPWIEEPGKLQSMWSQTVGQDWSNLACAHAHTHTHTHTALIPLCAFSHSVLSTKMGTLTICFFIEIKSLEKSSNLPKATQIKGGPSDSRAQNLNTMLCNLLLGYTVPYYLFPISQ